MSNATPKSSKRALLTSVLLALGATSCCTVPFILGLVGMGVASATWHARMDVLHPWFMGAMLVSLGVWAYRSYRARGAHDCSDGSCATHGSRFSRSFLIGHAALIVFVIGVPKLTSWLPSDDAVAADALSVEAAAEVAQAAPELILVAQAGGEEVVFVISDMNCQSCAIGIQAALRREAGVTEANVTFNPPHATVKFNPAETNLETLKAKIESLGYTVTGTAE